MKNHQSFVLWKSVQRSWDFLSRIAKFLFPRRLHGNLIFFVSLTVRKLNGSSWTTSLLYLCQCMLGITNYSCMFLLINWKILSTIFSYALVEQDELIFFALFIWLLSCEGFCCWNSCVSIESFSWHGKAQRRKNYSMPTKNI